MKFNLFSALTGNYQIFAQEDKNGHSHKHKTNGNNTVNYISSNSTCPSPCDTLNGNPTRVYQPTPFLIAKGSSSSRDSSGSSLRTSSPTGSIHHPGQILYGTCYLPQPRKFSSLSGIDHTVPCSPPSIQTGVSIPIHPSQSIRGNINSEICYFQSSTFPQLRSAGVEGGLYSKEACDRESRKDFANFPILSPASPSETLANFSRVDELVSERRIGPYRIEGVLGEGSYGKVQLGIHATLGLRVAIKRVGKASLKKPAHIVRLRREIRLLQLVGNHPHIVTLLDARETSTDVILVTEAVEGGELLTHVERRGGILSQMESRILFVQLVSAVAYLHSLGIVHRDIKPQNLLLSGDGTLLKLADFGFANTFSQDSPCSTWCGSPFYAAPEMVQGLKYLGPEVDIWSLGVVLYAMVTGNLPFTDASSKGLYAKIAAGKFSFPRGHLQLSNGGSLPPLEAETLDLIERLLTVNREKRMTISQLLRHPFVTRGSMEAGYGPVSRLPGQDCLKRSLVEMEAMVSALLQAWQEKQRSNNFESEQSTVIQSHNSCKDPILANLLFPLSPQAMRSVALIPSLPKINPADRHHMLNHRPMELSILVARQLFDFFDNITIHPGKLLEQRLVYPQAKLFFLLKDWMLSEEWRMETLKILPLY